VADGAAIELVEPATDAAVGGLRPGDEVLAVDGVPIEVAARLVPARARAYSAPHSREFLAYRYLLQGEPGTTFALTVEDSTGAVRTVDLRRESIAGSWDILDCDGYEAMVVGELTEEGIGYLAVERFEGPTLVERFDAKLSRLMDTRGMILDLRGNGGGEVSMADAILGRFVSEPILLGEDCAFERLDGEEHEQCEERWIIPRGRPYEGTMAVLIDEEVFSAAEVVAYALCRSGQAYCFGRTTAGETDYVMTWEIPGAVLRVSSADFRPAVGPSIQGQGLDPHEFVPLTAADLRDHQDPTFEAACRWALQQGEQPNKSDAGGGVRCQNPLRGWLRW
jgi:C-terminal processing protease CtpA/Prc